LNTEGKRTVGVKRGNNKKRRKTPVRGGRVKTRFETKRGEKV